MDQEFEANCTYFVGWPPTVENIQNRKLFVSTEWETENTKSSYYLSRSVALYNWETIKFYVQVVTIMCMGCESDMIEPGIRACIGYELGIWDLDLSLIYKHRIWAWVMSLEYEHGIMGRERGIWAWDMRQNLGTEGYERHTIRESYPVMLGCAALIVFIPKIDFRKLHGCLIQLKSTF